MDVETKNQMKKLFLSALLLPALAFGQLPNTEIWLYQYKFAAGKYLFTEGSNISNHEGYDNQPSFSPDGRYLLWTSVRDSGGTDIFRYDNHLRTTTQFTKTAVSEYSPTYFDKKNISCVVVEKDSTQRLYMYNAKSAQSKVIAPDFSGVGYHCWIDAHTVYFFKITEPSTLHRVNTQTCESTACDTNIGRCMQAYRYPAGDGVYKSMLLYTKEIDSARVILGRYPNGLTAPEIKIPAVPGSQDFVVDRAGNILMAKGTKLYIWAIGVSREWTEIADFNEKLHGITRMALSPDGKQLALVDNLTK
jgi:hypothetical protein